MSKSVINIIETKILPSVEDRVICKISQSIRLSREFWMNELLVCTNRIIVVDGLVMSKLLLLTNGSILRSNQTNGEKGIW